MLACLFLSCALRLGTDGSSVRWASLVAEGEATLDYAVFEPDGFSPDRAWPVLLVLPPLPANVLEYRFVGRDLILLDVEAHLIVDYILGAAPPLPTR